MGLLTADARTESPTSNIIAVTITVPSGQRAVIRSAILSQTTGTGGNEFFQILAAGTTVLSIPHTIATDATLNSYLPFAGGDGEDITVRARADDLTAGIVSVYYELEKAR